MDKLSSLLREYETLANRDGWRKANEVLGERIDRLLDLEVERAIEKSTDWLDKAVLYDQQGDYKRAEKCVKNAICLNPALLAIGTVIPYKIKINPNVTVEDLIETIRGGLSRFEDREEDPDQTYYWQREWQDGEQQADQDIGQGNYVQLDSIENLMVYLNSK